MRRPGPPPGIGAGVARVPRRGRGRGDAVTHRSQRGAATVLIVAMAGVLVLLGLAMVMVAAIVADQRRAQSAADLAALAGATTASRGGEACAAADAVARANGARIATCELIGREVTVEVVVDGPDWRGWSPALTAAARAGPAARAR